MRFCTQICFVSLHICSADDPKNLTSVDANGKFTNAAIDAKYSIDNSTIFEGSDSLVRLGKSIKSNRQSIYKKISEINIPIVPSN